MEGLGSDGFDEGDDGVEAGIGGLIEDAIDGLTSDVGIAGQSDLVHRADVRREDLEETLLITFQEAL